jgi:hypothetical protein
VCLVAAFVARDVRAQADAAVSVSRGLTGEMTFDYTGPALEARRQTDLDAPMLLRLERAADDETFYTARFIGAVEGTYDLTELIQHRDGRVPQNLAPLVVRVVSNLPGGAGTDLFEAADLAVDLRGGYRLTMLAIVAVWLAVPVVVIGYRLARSKAEEVVETAPPPPTLADQLRPLVQAAAQRALSTVERARLELLLYHFWRDRLAPAANGVADGIRIIRTDPVAGELFDAMDRWLHRPDPDAHDPKRLDALLAPYRAARPLADDAISGAETAVRP